MGHAENEYGWPNGSNTNDGQTVTGCTPKDSTACTMMSTVEEDIKSKILELIYWSKSKEERVKRGCRSRVENSTNMCCAMDSVW